MALNINYAGDGRQVQQADQVVDSGRVFGNRTKAVMSVPEVVKGQFGNSDAEMAEAQGLQNLAERIDDYVVREENLRKATEASQRQLQVHQQKAAELNARYQVDEIEKTTGFFDPQEREDTYNRLLVENVSKVNSQYNYRTSIGDNVKDFDEEFIKNSSREYKINVMEPIIVEKYKSNIEAAWKTGVSNIIDEGKQPGANIGAIAGKLKQLADSIATPEFNAAHGGEVKASEIRGRMLKQALQDYLLAVEPKQALSILVPPTAEQVQAGAIDPLAWMDNSDRQKLIREQGTLYRAEEAAKKTAKVEQDKETLKPFMMAIVNADNPRALAKAQADLQRKVEEGEIGFDAAYPVIKQLDSKKESLARRQEAEAEQALRRAEMIQRRQLQAAEIAERRKERQLEKADRLYSEASAGNKAAANEMWRTTYAPKLQNATMAQQAQKAIEFAKWSGVVPDEVSNTGYKLLNSKEPAEYNAGLKLFRDIKSASPTAYERLDRDTKDFVDLSQRHSPEAVREIIKANRSRSSEETKRLQKTAKDGMNNPVQALSDLTGWDKSKIPEPIKERFYQTYIENFIRTGDAEVAKAAAAQSIRQKDQVGTTKIGGVERVVVKPPEQVYHDEFNGNLDEIRKQIDQDVKSLGIPKGAKYGLEYAGDNKGKPVYSVRVTGDDGVPEILYHKDANGNPDRSRPVLIAPDPAKYKADKIKETQKKAVKNQAKLDKQKPIEEVQSDYVQQQLGTNY